MNIDILLKFMEKRKIIYDFLSVVYAKEISKKFLAEMPEKIKPLLALVEVFPDIEIKRKLLELVQFTDTFIFQNLNELETNLAVDYARLFLSINKVPPHPSESAYRDGTLMQSSRDEVLKTYWSFGINKTEAFAEPEDHIAIELCFLSYLCKKTVEALKNENIPETIMYVEGQRDFLEKHLVRWVPKLVKDIFSISRTPFYQAIAALTREYVEMDISAVKEVLAGLRVNQE